MQYEKFSPTSAKIIKIIPEHTEEEIVALVDLKIKLASLQGDLAQENARHLKEASGLNAEIMELETKIAEVEAVGVVEVEEVETPVETPVEIPTEVPTETPVEIPIEVPTETPIEIPIETPIIETPIETPVVETPAEALIKKIQLE